MPTDLEVEIRAVIASIGRLAVEVSALDREADLFALGLDSHAAVELMLALEDRYEIAFPDRLLTRGTFRSIATLAAALGELLPAEVRP